MHDLITVQLPKSDPHGIRFRSGRNDAVFNRSRIYVHRLISKVLLFAPDVWLRVEREAETHGLDLVYLWWFLIHARAKWGITPRLKYALRGALSVFLLMEHNSPGRYFSDAYDAVLRVRPPQPSEIIYFDLKRPIEQYGDIYDVSDTPPVGIRAPEEPLAPREAIAALARWADLEFRRTIMNIVLPVERNATKDIEDLYLTLYEEMDFPARHYLLWDIQEGFVDKNRLNLKDRIETESLLRWLYNLKLRRMGVGGPRR
jgi:hypothetical protein